MLLLYFLSINFALYYCFRWQMALTGDAHPFYPDTCSSFRCVNGYSKVYTRRLALSPTTVYKRYITLYNIEHNHYVMSYGKFSKISNTFLFLFSYKILVFRAGIHKNAVRIANSEYLYQIASSEAVWSGSALFF